MAAERASVAGSGQGLVRRSARATDGRRAKGKVKRRPVYLLRARRYCKVRRGKEGDRGWAAGELGRVTTIGLCRSESAQSDRGGARRAGN